MSEPGFPTKWKIAASSSLIFPAGSRLEMRPVPQTSRFEFRLEREGQATKTLFEKELPQIGIPGAAPSVRGDFDDGKLLLVMTLCPGKDEKALKLLCGQVHENAAGAGNPGGTGVWVAEEEPKRPPGGSADRRE